MSENGAGSEAHSRPLETNWRCGSFLQAANFSMIAEPQMTLPRARVLHGCSFYMTFAVMFAVLDAVLNAVAPREL